MAALARRDQLTSRIGEVDPHAVPRIAAPPVSFAAALSENARLEQVLSSLTLTRSEPHNDEASDELRPVVDEHDAPLLGDVPVDRERADRDHRRRIPVTLTVFGPVALETNGLEIDGVALTATFMAGWDGAMFQGGATLRLDPTP